MSEPWREAEEAVWIKLKASLEQQGRIAFGIRDAHRAGWTARDRTAEAEIAALKAEITRLRNIANEDGLVDPELAAGAGEAMSPFEAAILPPQKFKPPGSRP